MDPERFCLFASCALDSMHLESLGALGVEHLPWVFLFFIHGWLQPRFALLRPARLLEAEQACSSLTRYSLWPVCVVVLLFVLLAPWVLGGATGRMWP